MITRERILALRVLRASFSKRREGKGEWNLGIFRQSSHKIYGEGLCDGDTPLNSRNQEKIKSYFAEQWDGAALRLIRAITEDDQESIKTLLAMRAPADVWVEGDTALTRAVILGRLRTVKALIKHGVDLNARDEQGRTPLMLAAHHGIEKILRMILEKGADPNAVAPRGKTALIEAAEYGHMNCVRLLLRVRVNVNAQERGWFLNGETALMKAAYEGFEGIVDLLLKAKADVNLHADFNGATALGLAAKMGHLGIVRMLLAHKAEINSADDGGRTPLTEAVENNHVKVAKYLSNRRAK